MGGNRTLIVDQDHLDHGEDPDYEPWIVGYHRHLRAGGEVTTQIPAHLRRITVEEAAILQGFPTGVRWQGASLSSRYRQIGNAVPPPLAAAVARTVASMLACRPSLSVEAA